MDASDSDNECRICDRIFCCVLHRDNHESRLHEKELAELPDKFGYCVACRKSIDSLNAWKSKCLWFRERHAITKKYPAKMTPTFHPESLKKDVALILKFDGQGIKSSTPNVEEAKIMEVSIYETPPEKLSLVFFTPNEDLKPSFYRISTKDNTPLNVSLKKKRKVTFDLTGTPRLSPPSSYYTPPPPHPVPPPLQQLETSGGNSTRSVLIKFGKRLRKTLPKSIASVLEWRQKRSRVPPPLEEIMENGVNDMDLQSPARKRPCLSENEETRG